MKRLVCLLPLLAALGCGGSSEPAPPDERPVVLELDDLKAPVPKSWREEPATTTMRFAQFRLPGGLDAGDAEVVVFKGLGGSAEDNVKRWKGQFIPPKGKKIDDVASVRELKVAGHPATYLDVTGTYLDGGPMVPAEKKVKRDNHRMLAVHLEGPRNLYHVLLRGPAATVAEYKEGFDDWLKGLRPADEAPADGQRRGGGE